MTVVAVRLPEDLLALVDKLIKRGVYANRTEAVKAGLAAVLEQQARIGIDRKIARGFERLPETEEELAAAQESTRALISEEPW